MGQRANLVISKNGAWRLYYDHWCANRLDVELFWGPDTAIRFIEQREPCANTEWLDDIWCEGAVVVDIDAKVLLFYGGEDILWEIPLRRAYLALLTETWPGWTIRWAHEGIVAVGAHVGVAEDTFLSADGPGREDQFRVLTEYPEDNQTLLTTTIEGVATARQVFGDEKALALGPALLDVLKEVEGSPALNWQGDMPTDGLHVDFDRKAVCFWWAHDTPAIEDRVAAGWPGWDAIWLRDRYEEHLARAGLDIRLPERSLAALQAELLAQFRRRCHKEEANPARELASRIGATSISPATDEARGSVGDQARKLELLKRLESRLPIGEQ